MGRTIPECLNDKLNPLFLKMYYLRFSIIHIDEEIASRDSIFSILSYNYSRHHHVEAEHVNSNFGYHLEIRFLHPEEFHSSFQRNIPLVEAFLAHFQEIPSSKQEMQYKIPDPSHWGEDYTFLILKLETNNIENIRNDFHLSFQVARLAGIGIAYEEIETGMLIFFKRRSDFDFLQLDKTNPVLVAEWLKKNMVLSKNHLQFLSEVSKPA